MSNQNLNKEDLVMQASTAGLKEFDRESYSKALKIFARGISYAEKTYIARKKAGSKEKYHPHYPDLLDHRAACFEKLNKLEYALMDADKLIKVDHYGCKGYLRKAKIYKLLKREKDAYYVLDEGIKKIESGLAKYKGRLKVPDALLSRMTIQRDDFYSRYSDEIDRKRGYDDNGEGSRKKARSTILDLFQVFPYEIISLIIRQLDQKTILNCLFVSHLWYSTIYKIPEVFEEPRLASQLTTRQMLRFVDHLKRCNKGRSIKQIRSLKLEPRLCDETPIISELFSKDQFLVKNLSLVLRKTSNVEIHKLLMSSNYARNLFGRVEELSLYTPVIESGNGIKNVLKYTSSLKELSIFIPSIGELPPLFDKVRDEDINEHFLNQLQKLTVLCPPSINVNLTKRFSNNLLSGFHGSSIKELHLSHCVIDRNNLKLAIGEMSHLKSLKIDNIADLTTSFLIENIHSDARLETLAVRETKTFEVQHLRSQSHGRNLAVLNNLKELRLSCTTISYQGLIHILSNTNENITKLYLNLNNHIVFVKSAFDTTIPVRGGYFDAIEVLGLVPKIKELSFAQAANFTDYSLQLLAKAIAKIDVIRHLSLLDISFNIITGRGVMELFTTSCWRKGWQFKVDKFGIDGCDVSPETTSLLVKKGFCSGIGRTS